MSTHQPETCRRAHELTSAFLDGRLDAQRRGALQRHLKQCPACLQNLRETERLARATHNLPPHRHAPDLASRVRAAVQDRRQDRAAALDGGRATPRDRGLRWLLLASLLTLAWSIGYHMGNDGPAAPTQPTVSGPRHDDLAFASTSRRVLGDLTIAADLPQRQRRPLLESQLELFDLRARAERVLAATAPHSAEHQLAALVLDLGRALKQGDADWRGLRRRAPAPQNAAEAAPQAQPRPEGAPLQAVLARHGERLSQGERDELEHFLQLKRRLVSGEHVTAQEFHWSSSDGSTSVSGFSVASGFAGVRSMMEAGQVEQADELQRRMQEMLRSLRQADGGPPKQRRKL